MQIFICKSLLLGCLYLPLIVSAQTIDNIKAELDALNGNIIISYNFNLNSENKNKYKIEAFYSIDSGKTYSEPLEFVSGEVGNDIKPGNNKKISWNYFVEFPDFDGQHIMFKIRARIDREYEENQILELQGAEQVWRSAILPGWGDNQVRLKKNYWWVGGLAYGLAGSGLYMRLKANNTFDKYKKSFSVEEADDLFAQSNQQKKTGNYLLLAGGAIWLTDMVLVLIKGSNNRKKQAEILKRREQTGFHWHIQPTQIGLTYKF
jgi:Family of unknown function (DUF5683)